MRSSTTPEVLRTLDAAICDLARHMLYDMDEDTPNPGSDAAFDLGCTCPIMDNNHGKWKPWPGNWWITEGCPLHAPAD